MTRASDRLRERMLDLAWSLWTGLGVPGQIDNHGDCAIDPEPLILFTAGLGDADPRLRDEATDWCIRYGQLVSGTRLKNLLVREGDEVRAGFGEFAATVAKHSSLRWLGSTAAREHSPRERPKVKAFNRPSQVVLRLRALMGVGARADVIRVFLGRPDAALGAADLATEIGYAKRNVALALEMLRLGDVLDAFPIRNQIHFRISRANVERLRSLLGEMPRTFPRWSPFLRVVSRVHETAKRVEKLSPKVQAVEMMAVVRDLADDIRDAEIPSPPSVAREEYLLVSLVSWCAELSGYVD